MQHTPYAATYCVLRIAYRPIAYCVLRIAYCVICVLGPAGGPYSLLRIAYCVLRIAYCAIPYGPYCVSFVTSGLQSTELTDCYWFV